LYGKKKNSTDAKVEEGVVLTRDQVKKYYEVRLRSLAIMAVMIVILCIFLFFFFIWRGQFLYAALMAGVAVIVALAGARLTKYAGLFRKAK
jgi:flagellar biosynthesis/type III secretory pathway M-ring protein FliF/YscJ